MKVPLHSQREYEIKVRQLEEKLDKYQKKNKESSKENKRLRKRLKELSASRDKWKSKNRSKWEEVKGLRKRLGVGNVVKRHPYALWLIVLCVGLRTVAGCSYRSIVKVLALLRVCGILYFPKAPCANTVENWVSKMGYHCMEKGLDRLSSRELCLIIDESLKQGNERLLLLVVTPWQKEREVPLGYVDTLVCYVGGSASWTGEKIRDVAQKVAREARLEIRGVLSDEDGKLLKAARLMGIPHLPDISHAVASCLRKAFEKDADYAALVKLVTSLQARAVNQDLSHLRPPKQRVKARFMNQKEFVNWGLALLDQFGQLNEKEKAFFAGLHAHRPMLETLTVCIDIGENVARILKTGGLSKASAKAVGLMLDGHKSKEGLTRLFLGHLQSYLDKYDAFLADRDGVFNASSDIIESMFGRNKNSGASNTLVGVTQMDLEMAVYCLQEEDLPRFAKDGLESVFTSDLKKWRIDHSSGNQALRRKKIFKNQV